MTFRIGKWAGLVAVAVTLASPASVLAADDAKAEVAAGYGYLHDSSIDTTFPGGWFASVAGNITPMFAVVGEVDGSYKTISQRVGATTVDATAKVHTFLGGPRVTARAGAASVYGQFLVGAAHGTVGASASGAGGSISVSDSGTDFCYVPGVGVDVALSPNLGVRVGANFRFVKADSDTAKEQQIIAGVVYRFGK